MLVWLASYPRSGNRLLRQILWRTMGLKTYHESQTFELPGEYDVLVGDEFADLDELRRHAAESDDLFLVKTHLPPSDDSPALYVVRDGRAAITSFLKYERTFAPNSNPTLIRLVLGDHFYGGWSDHYRAWHCGDAEVLDLEYSSLFAADADVVGRIASFVGYDGPIAPWQNKIESGRLKAPGLVGPAHVVWDAPDEWDAVCDTAFWERHGDLMHELALDDGWRRVPPLSDEERASLLGVVTRFSKCLETQESLSIAAVEKEETIRLLREEATLQARVAAERLETIVRIEREAGELAASVTELERERDLQALTAAERLAAIQELERERDHLRATAEERLAALERESSQSAAAIENEEAMGLLREEATLQARVAAERLETIERIGREAGELAASVTQLERERDLQARAAAERLAAIQELERERDHLRATAEERLTALAALERERDLQAKTAAERLEALEALERESAVRLQALEELAAQRHFSG